jgi:hypothetical protein
VLTGVDYFARSLARSSGVVRDPARAATLDPAAERVRANLDALRAMLLRREAREVRSAEEAVDAAEVHAARTADARLRRELLEAVRVLRRIDQAAVGFAADLAGAERSEEPATVRER